MAFDNHPIFGYALVATAPSPATSGTSLVVTAGFGALLGTPPLNMTIWPTGANPITSNAEIVRVTNISTDTLTIVRAQEGSSARTILVGDQIAATMTPKTFTDIETAFVQKSGDTMTGDLTLNTNLNLVSTNQQIYYDGSGILWITNHDSSTGGRGNIKLSFSSTGGILFDQFGVGTVAFFGNSGFEIYNNTFPHVNNTYNNGSASLYWANLYATRLNVNSTAYFDGGTAGSITTTANLASTGNISVSGDYNESTTTAGVFFGGPGSALGTPRMLYANGTASQNWQIDNNGGTFRWFTPGVVQMSMGLNNGDAVDIAGHYLGMNEVSAPSNAGSGKAKLYASSSTHRLLFGSNTGGFDTMPTLGSTDTFTNKTIGDKLKITTGANTSAGTGTLVAGTATISTTAVTASSLIFLTDTASSITNVGSLTVSAKTAGTSFVVTSTLALDTSTFNWLIIN